MKTIIAGTDFSASSVNACRYAALLAQKLNCKLTIFNLFQAPLVHSNMGLYGISYSSQRSSSVDRTNKVVIELQKLFPKVKIGSFVTTGSFESELEDFAAKHQVQAAVMGLEAKEKLVKFIYGSHSVNIAAKINCPVIIVPSGYKHHKLSKILLAVDNNEKLLKSPLKGFEKFIKDTNSKLEILHVRTPNEIFDPITNTLKLNGKRLSIEVLKAQNITDGIKKHSAVANEDMVAVLSKKHSAFYNFFSESNTKRIAFASKLPVMAIHE